MESVRAHTINITKFVVIQIPLFLSPKKEIPALETYKNGNSVTTY